MTATRLSKANNNQESRPLLRTTSSLVSESSAADMRSSSPVASAPSVAVGWIRNAWIVHTLVGLAVLSIAVWRNNDESKYIPVKITTWQRETCQRAFVNVLAYSSEEEGAVQCCVEGNNLYNEESFNSFPCAPSKLLPFERSLTNFPEAWLYPLFPWLYRIIWECLEPVPSLRRKYVAHAMRRFGLYLTIMLIRGWILYVALNALESNLVAVELLPVDEDFCWYKDLLRQAVSIASSSASSSTATSATNSTTCYGRMFDFSDHVVFYFVQFLAIVWTECLDALASCATGPRTSGFVFLCGMVLYLHIIVYAGVYKTARWFHTGSEIFLGYAISLTVTVPLAWWQSHTLSPCRDRRSA